MTCLKILVWGNGWERLISRAASQLTRRTGTRVSTATTSYVGGGQFFAHQASGNEFDIFIADRELLSLYADGHRLHALSTNSKERAGLKELFPPWLRKWFLARDGIIYGLPLRWGSIGSLVSKKLWRHVENKPAEERVKLLMSQSENMAVWSPNGYFLPSMTVFAAGVKPYRSTVLNRDAFDELKKLMELSVQRQPRIVYGIDELTSALSEDFPDFIPCAGDWVLRTLEAENAGALEKLKERYEYWFPWHNEEPLVFFETGAVRAGIPDAELAVDLLRLLASPEFRRTAEEFGTHQDSYQANPTVDNLSILAQHYTAVQARAVLKVASPRDIPRAGLMQPAFHVWSSYWTAWEKSILRS